MTNRRKFLAGAAAATIGGAATATTLYGAQAKPLPPRKQIETYKGQIKWGVGIMNAGNPVGAVIAATAFVNWAAYMEENKLDAVVRDVVRRQGPRRGTMNHAAEAKLANELGIDKFMSIHTDPAPFDVRTVYNDIVRGPAASVRMAQGAKEILALANATSWPAGKIAPVQWPYPFNSAECPVCAFAADYYKAAVLVCEAIAPSVFMGPAAVEAATAACAGVMSMSMVLRMSCQLAQVYGCT